MAEEPNREFLTSTGKVIHLQPVANRLFTDAQADVEREFADAKKHKLIQETTRVRYPVFWSGLLLISISYLLPFLVEVGVF